jgi:hypothetical protein
MSKQQMEKIETQEAVARYDKDFFRWTQETAELLRQRRFDEVDLEHVAEEIHDMGLRDHREVRSRLVVLLMHLLKWPYQPERRSRSWRGTLREQRRQLSLVLRDSPTLVHFAANEIETAYSDAIEGAMDETDLPRSSFPKSCPYTASEVLNKDFLPGPLPTQRS